MDEPEQRDFLQRLVEDIERRAGCKVVLKRWDKEGRRLSLRVSYPDQPKEKAFGFATIRPLKGCLSLITWEKCLKNVDPDMIPHWELVDNLEFRSAYGPKCWHCEANGEVYEEAVHALSTACRYYSN